MYGETWAYESLVGALPGVDLSPRAALAVQFVGFEALLLALAAVYDLWSAVPAGTAAVVVATAGSALMLALGREIRAIDAPEPYRRLLFGSSAEVALGMFAFLALVVHLFVYDPRQGGETLLVAVFGENPPVVVVYFALAILWDLVYRIGVGWWAAVVAVWRSYRYSFDGPTAARLRRVDALNLAFGLVQVVLIPFVADRPVLLAAVAGHVLAVTAATALSVGLLSLPLPTGATRF